MWERSLRDLIRGLRANKDDEGGFIKEAVAEIKTEIRTSDLETKAAAIQKLTYLDMLGVDISWASFYIVELMSSQKYGLKRIGYLAAKQSFHHDTDVLMLTTNLLKKDMASAQALDLELALNGAATLTTLDLSRDLVQDIVRLIAHPKPVVRKKAIIALYRAQVENDALQDLMISTLAERLEDSDSSVVTTAVNCLCELGTQRPEDILFLSPRLFDLLNASSNNWTVIKLVKLFSKLTTVEPRLVRKLLPAIAKIIETTEAMSLLYECIHAVIAGAMLNDPEHGERIATSCVHKLAGFLSDDDHNLRYIALLALVKIMPTHLELLHRYRTLFTNCLDDPDLNIRLRSLDIVGALITRHDVIETVGKLLNSLQTTSLSAIENLQGVAASKSVYRDQQISQSTWHAIEVMSKILALTSKDAYALVPNFDWYIVTLLEMDGIARQLSTNGDQVGRTRSIRSTIANDLRQACVRVPSLRPFAVKQCALLVDDEDVESWFTDLGPLQTALAWILGEYAVHLEDPGTVCVRALAVVRQDQRQGAIEMGVAQWITAIPKIFVAYLTRLVKNNAQIPAWTTLRQLAEYARSTLLGTACSSAPEIAVPATLAIGTLDILVVICILSESEGTQEDHGSEMEEVGSRIRDQCLQAFGGDSKFAKEKLVESLLAISSSEELLMVDPEAQESIVPPRDLDLGKWIGDTIFADETVVVNFDPLQELGEPPMQYDEKEAWNAFTEAEVEAVPIVELSLEDEPSKDITPPRTKYAVQSEPVYVHQEALHPQGPKPIKDTARRNMTEDGVKKVTKVKKKKRKEALIEG